MKNEGVIRGLQLSDLHVQDSTELRVQKRKLCEQFKNKIDFIVVTGDLHEFGQGYMPTRQFLNQLAEELKLEREDIIIVPGNHDNADFNGKKEILERIGDKIAEDPDAYLDNLEDLYWGFGKYIGFCKEFYERDVNYECLVNHIEIWKDKIAFLCVNTALASDKDHDKKQIVDIAKLEELENCGYPCIVLMHHDCESIAQSQQPFLRSAFEKMDVRAILCGHKHRYAKDYYFLGGEKKVPVYCCAKSVPTRKDNWSNIGVIEYVWKIEDGSVSVVPYEWSTDSHFFKQSTEFEKDNLNNEDELSLSFGSHFNLGKTSDENVKEPDKQKGRKKSQKKKIKVTVWRIAAAVLFVAIILAVIVLCYVFMSWGRDAGSELRLSDVSEGNYLFVQEKTMEDAWVQAIGQIVIVKKDGTVVKTYIIDDMYEETNFIRNSKEVRIQKLECLLAESCSAKLEQELERILEENGYDRDEAVVKEIGFVCISVLQPGSEERELNYYILENDSLIRLDAEAAEKKKYGVKLTAEIWENAEEQKMLLDEMREQVLLQLQKDKS